MSFRINKPGAGAVILDDLGITVTGTAGTERDLREFEPGSIQASTDLAAAIAAGTIEVLDPRDNTTILSIADGELARATANDTQYGINGGRFTGLDAPGTTPSDQFLVKYDSGTDEYVSVDPSTVIGDNEEAVEDIVGAMGINGTDTTFTYNDTNGTIVWQVDDSYLRNNGDTLDSGTLNVASGATIAILTGGELTIADAPVNATDAANKAYVDSVASGLDPKESVRYCTVLDVGGTYSAVGGAGGSGAFTGVDLTSAAIFDGLDVGAIIIGDRILVKEQTADAGFADALITGAQVGPTVPGIGAATYDFDVTIDGGGLQQLAVVIAGTEDLDAIAALMDAQVVGGTVAFVSSSFRVTSSVAGAGSAATVAVGTGVNTDLFAAIDAALTEVTSFPTPTAGGGDTENGIYEVTTAGAAGAMQRSSDQDGTPANEVSSGNFTFVEGGTTCAATGWVLQGDGILTLNVDPILWVQFTGAGEITPGLGLSKAGNTIDLDVGDLVTESVVSGDFLAFHDINGTPEPSGSQTRRITASSFITDLDIVTATANGIVVRTAADTYAARSIAVAAGNLDGLSVSNADGVSGDPTVGLDIQNMNLRAAVDAANDRVVVWDSSLNTNVYYTIADISATSTPTKAFETVSGDTGSAVADSPTDTLSLIGATNGGITTVAADGPESVTFGITPVDLATGSATLVLGDFVIVSDSADAATVVAQKYTLTDLVQDLDIPNAITTNGFVVRTAEDVYASRTLDASTDEDELGLTITNGDGISGDPQIGFDIVGLTNPAAELAATDEFAVHDKSEGTAGANRKMTGQNIADGTATILGIDNLTFDTFPAVVGTQTLLAYTDASRSKVLSVEAGTYLWSDNKLSDNDWLRVGSASDADSGWVMPMDGTITMVSAHCENVPTGNTFDIDLYIDGPGAGDSGSIANLVGPGEQEDTDVTLSIDFAAGAKLRLRADQSAGTDNLADTTVALTVHWRS